MRFQVVGKEDIVEGITVRENQSTYYPGCRETTGQVHQIPTNAQSNIMIPISLMFFHP